VKQRGQKLNAIYYNPRFDTLFKKTFGTFLAERFPLPEAGFFLKTIRDNA